MFNRRPRLSLGVGTALIGIIISWAAVVACLAFTLACSVEQPIRIVEPVHIVVDRPEKTVVLGDSITNQGYLREDGWVHQYLTGNIVNEGHDGYNTRDLDRYLRGRAGRQIEGATRVTLDIGSNNYLQARGCASCLDANLEAFKSEFDDIMWVIRNVVPCATVVVGELYDFGYLDTLDNSTNRRLHEFEKAINAYIHEKVGGLGRSNEAVAPVAVAFGDSRGLVLPDGMHPNTEGHARLARAFSSVDPQPQC